MSDEQKQTCECPTRKALELAINTVECASIDLKEGPAKGEELPWYKAARAALSAPCPCAELRENATAALKLAERFQERALTAEAERDSLRAELADAKYVKQKALEYGVRLEPEVEALRAKVETLTAALKPFAAMMIGVHPQDSDDFCHRYIDPKTGDIRRAAAALKDAQPQENGTPKA